MVCGASAVYAGTTSKDEALRLAFSMKMVLTTEAIIIAITKIKPAIV